MSNTEHSKSVRRWQHPTMQSKLSQLRLDRLRALLAIRPMTRAEIAGRLHASIQSVYRYLRHLREQKEVYVGHWERNPDGGQPIAYFTLGSKKDAPKPRPFTEAEQAKRCYSKMKRQEPAKYTAYLERARHQSKIRYRLNRGLPLVPTDPMLVWIPQRTGSAEDAQQTRHEGATATQCDFVMQRPTHDALPELKRFDR